MPPKPGHRGLSINMSPDERSAVDELARAEGFKTTAEYVRFLIEQRSESIGKPLKFAVKWGGHRGRASQSDGNKQE